MLRVLLSTIGSRGEVQPVALRPDVTARARRFASEVRRAGASVAARHLPATAPLTSV